MTCAIGQVDAGPNLAAGGVTTLSHWTQDKGKRSVIEMLPHLKTYLAMLYCALFCFAAAGADSSR